MDINHVFLQYKRLERHYRASLEQKDTISFLDLSHCLRIWVEMKNELDELVKSKGVNLKLSNPTASKNIKRILKGSSYTYLPLGGGVDSPGIKMKGVMGIDIKGSPDEIGKLAKKLYEAGPPTESPTTLRYSEWLASGIYEVPSNDKTHPQIRISREILIKRVANMLGASHPIGTTDGDDKENKFDPYILELHNIKIADGYPATYYELLEIAGSILKAIKVLFEPSTNR